MKSFIRTFLLAGIGGGLFWGLYLGWVQEFRYSVWLGIVLGVLSGLAAAIIERYRENKVSESLPALDDEVVIRDGRSMHDGMSGWLYLTNQRVLFEGYPTDETSPEISTLFDRFPSDTADGHHVSIPLLQISRVARRAIGIESRIDLVLSDGRTLYFGTEDSAEWADDIVTVRQKCLDEPRSENSKLFP